MALASSMYCDSSNWNPISCTCMESLEEILASVGHGPSKSRWTVPAYVDLIFFPLSCHLQSCSHYRDSCKDSLWGGRSGVPCRLAVFYLLPLGLNDKCGWFGSWVFDYLEESKKKTLGCCSSVDMLCFSQKGCLLTILQTARTTILMAGCCVSNPYL